MQKHWWHRCVFVKRYMPAEDKIFIRQMIQELDDVVNCGYHAIQITAPYKSAGFEQWWGLRPLEYFELNQCLRSDMDGFRELVTACHQRGLHVIVFLNLGYADSYSEFWQRVCRDRRMQNDSLECRYFLWSDTGTEPLEKEGNAYYGCICSEYRWPVIGVYNFSNEEREAAIYLEDNGLAAKGTVKDLICDCEWPVEDVIRVVLPPLGYGFYAL